MKHALISIIVPVYGVEPYLEKCVRSIMAQTYRNIEIILVDDGSTDNCPQICDNLAKEDDRVVVIHKANGGQSSARNAGLDIASGEYIGFVDSDDYIEPTMYEDMLNAIINKKGAVASVGIRNEYTDGKLISEFNSVSGQVRAINRDDFYKSLLMYEGDSSVWSKLFPRTVIGNVRFKEGRLNEDVLFNFEIFDSFTEVVFTGNVGYHYIVRTGSTTRSFGKPNYDMVYNAHEIYEIIKKNIPGLIRYAERFEIYQNMMFLNACPKDYNRKGDPLFHKTRQFLLKSFLKACFNSYLNAKDKVRMCVLIVSPKLFSHIKHQIKIMERK